MFRNKILSDNLPEHIGIIMDGNGRWATKRGLPRNVGHREGIKAIDRTIDALIKNKIKYVTFFAFSTENWKRSREEIDGIFDLVRKYLQDNRDNFDMKNVKVISIGDLSKFPDDLVQELEKIKEKTKDNTGLVVNLALNYGGRDDVLQAARASKGNQEDFEKNLYTHKAGLPDPDFVIRTSGEERLSNFMMYQLAYAELYFPKVLWPDFDEKDLNKALAVFCKRDRRYGGLK